jgi:site-specific recombinase XerD
MYKIHLDRFNQVLKGKRVENITTADIVLYHQMMKIKYAPATIAYALVIIRNFLSFLKIQKITSIDPFVIKVPKFQSKRMPVASDEDITKMLLCLSDWTYTDVLKKLCLCLLRDTGMRVSELCDLNVSDIDTRNTYTMIVTKKSYGTRERLVMWRDDTHQLLLKYLGVRISLNQTKPLLMSYTSRKRVTPRTIERWVGELARKAHITTHITPHSFRHGKAHRMVAQGANVKEIQVILGHSEDNPKASFQYLRLDTSESKKIAEKYIS